MTNDRKLRVRFDVDDFIDRVADRVVDRLIAAGMLPAPPPADADPDSGLDGFFERLREDERERNERAWAAQAAIVDQRIAQLGALASDGLISLGQAADLVGVTRATIRAWTVAGRIVEAGRVGRQIRLRAADVRDAVAAGRASVGRRFSDG